MPIVVKAVSEQEFDAWVAEQQAAQALNEDSDRTWSKAELMAKGEDVYNNCTACHGVDGKGVPDVFPPIAGSDVVKGAVAKHLEVVMEGRSGTTMQAFKDQLSDVELAAVITYQRNAFGNDTGDLVQPSDIGVLR